MKIVSGACRAQSWCPSGGGKDQLPAVGRVGITAALLRRSQDEDLAQGRAGSPHSFFWGCRDFRVGIHLQSSSAKACGVRPYSDMRKEQFQNHFRKGQVWTRPKLIAWNWALKQIPFNTNIFKKNMDFERVGVLCYLAEVCVRIRKSCSAHRGYG